MNFTKAEIDAIAQKTKGALVIINRYKLENLISEFERKLGEPEVWSDNKLVTEYSIEMAGAKKKLQVAIRLQDALDELQIAFEVEEWDIVKSVNEELTSQLDNIENLKYLSGKFDNRNVILSVQSGAGGVDAEDWAGMLCSMYQATAKREGWILTTTDLSAGTEGGIKNCDMRIEGENVYGLLKEEFGVHRLVRLSPFNAGHTRETSFALVQVMPIGVEDEIKIEIKEDDLKWDYFMSGGSGGQSVNTTYSAVRLTHLPTKISVQCQNERSQAQNKAMALKYLSSKLAILEAEQKQEFREEFRGSLKSAEWGSQIRSYVLHPYKLVKDLRSNWETNNVEDILENGNIIPIIWSVKRASEAEK